MYSKDLDPEQALELIRKTRPYIEYAFMYDSKS